MQIQRPFLQAMLSVSLASFCTFGHAKTASPKNDANTLTGVASYYSDKFHGRRTANGERYDKNGFTAMHRWLPFGTRIRVINLSNYRAIEVRVNDRGHRRNRRLLDLSRRAAAELGMLRSGIAQVRVEVLQGADS